MPQTERAGSGQVPYLDSFNVCILIEGTRPLHVPYLSSIKQQQQGKGVRNKGMGDSKIQ